MTPASTSQKPAVDQRPALTPGDRIDYYEESGAVRTGTYRGKSGKWLQVEVFEGIVKIHPEQVRR